MLSLRNNNIVAQNKFNEYVIGNEDIIKFVRERGSLFGLEGNNQGGADEEAMNEIKDSIEKNS